jgi:holliday junction DNA helicase RuvA
VANGVIASLSGAYQTRTGESIVLDVGGVGYLIYLPPVVWDALGDIEPRQPLNLKIFYQASAQQPKPTLFGFLTDEEKDFFELLAGIPRLGGRNAAKAMVLPVNVLATAIQEGNRELLDRLPGVSSTGAEKIIASLRKKVATFTTLEHVAAAPPADTRDELKADATDLLVVMDVKKAEANRGVEQILEAEPDICTVQDVITEFFRRRQKMS